jgi:hypothetical protein
MLEIRLKTATPCHFLICPAQRSGGESIVTKRCFLKRCDLSSTPRILSENLVS